MAFVLTNYFNVLADEELDDVSKLTNDVPKKNPTSFPESRRKKKQQQQAAAKKKQETKPDPLKMRAKPIVGQDRVVRKEITKTPKQRPKFDAVQDQQQQEEVFERKLSSLKEYEKQLLEKKKSLNALNKPDEGRKVSLDKEFESMKLVSKKKFEDINKSMKLPKSNKDQAKLQKVAGVSGSFTATNAVAKQRRK